jgi:hypothetical protein
MYGMRRHTRSSNPRTQYLLWPYTLQTGTAIRGTSSKLRVGDGRVADLNST